MYGPERIVERRYYVKKAQLVPRRDQLTSTTDLTESGIKARQLSGVSSMSGCSQCSSTAPDFLENLRNESTLLRNEIGELKTEIEYLQTSQETFFEQFKMQFQPKANSVTTLQSLSKNEFFVRSISIIWI